MKYNRLLLVCFATLLFAACQGPQSTHIQIVCTGDVHGHLFPTDFITGDSARGSLARVSSYLKEPIIAIASAAAAPLAPGATSSEAMRSN